MGNCVSTSGVIAPKIRVVQASERRVVDVELPPLQSSMMVGELMLEFPPGHFVAHLNLKPNSSAASSTDQMRATPLGADADAQPGTVYVLFPMPRLHTRITPQELLSFAKLLHLHDQQQLTNNQSKVHVVHGRFMASARVAPVAEEACIKDANIVHRDADTKEQACPLPISFRKQQNEQEPMSYPDSSSGMLSSICSQQGHMGVIKRKPWAPRLQTIMESS